MQSLGWGLFIFCAIFSLLTSFAWRALAEPPLLRRDLIADTQADPAKEYAHWASLSFHVKLDVGATVSEQPLSGMWSLSQLRDCLLTESSPVSEGTPVWADGLKEWVALGDLIRLVDTGYWHGSSSFSDRPLATAVNTSSRGNEQWI